MTEKIFRFHNESGAAGGVNWRVNVLDEIFLLHTHDYYEIEYASEGTGTNRINGIEYPILPGSVWLLGPNDDHMLEGQNLKIHHLGMYMPELSRDLSSLLEEASAPMVGVLDSEADRRTLASYFALFSDAPEQDVLRERQYQAAATLILVFCLSRVPKASQVATKTANYIRHAIRYINEHIGEPISLADVCNELYIVPCYLSAIFSEHAGCPFNEYVTRSRLRHARTLLLRTDKSVTDVAGECGFGCVSAMNRAFRKYLNTCPSALRKKTNS